MSLDLWVQSPMYPTSDDESLHWLGDKHSVVLYMMLRYIVRYVEDGIEIRTHLSDIQAWHGQI
jgi:hypothetical protein